MTSSAQSRLLEDRLAPRIVTLWHALAPLKSVVSFMNTGAHPDDETSEMLAALGYRDGLDLSYACATRGEGGQNDIGRETAQALGALRTAEMERAAYLLNLRLYWLCEHPEDTITDFGFSKSGAETLAKWGHARTLDRFVHIIRRERPDIICPTFLDVPGQHGHHRAMTRAAHEVMGLAADPDYPCDVPAWQVSKLYLPAWSGAGQAYDDDLPPPPATLVVNGRGRDPITGWSYDRIGQYSRACHRTQGMGQWTGPEDARDWPLHLAQSHVSGPDLTLEAGLPQSLDDLGFGEIQRAIDETCAAFPVRSAILSAAMRAMSALTTALDTAHPFQHKLERKRTQLAHVIRIAAGVEVRSEVAATRLTPGAETEMSIESFAGDADALEVKPILPDFWTCGDATLKAGIAMEIGDAAPPTPAYPDSYLPDDPSAPCLSVKICMDGMNTESRVPLQVAPSILPTYAARITPSGSILNLACPKRHVDLIISDINPPEAIVTLDLPTDWHSETTERGFRVTLPQDVPAKTYEIRVLLDGTPARTPTEINHAHAASRVLLRQATIQICVLNVAVPDVRVGYIGGGHDRVDHLVRSMGIEVANLSDSDLRDEALLAGFDSLIIGIFALKSRPVLAAQMSRLHDWARRGGTLLTLYHRPWDNWDADKSPPRRLEIGQPSLRWRVTDETAPVTYLLPDHPLLTAPNQITTQDWDGWHKERGLYFAKSWDAAYRPLLSMADRGEEALTGALLSADIGEGRHIHTSLILHHQMEHLVPGAYRLMANFLACRPKLST